MSSITYPKTDNDVATLVGKVIQFNDQVEMSEIDFDSGMKARVVGYAITDPGEVFKLQLDFSEFEESNKLLMQSNYYDKNNMPNLKWCETRNYPSDCKTYEYFGYKYEGADCFDVVEEYNKDKAIEDALQAARLLCANLENGGIGHMTLVKAFRELDDKIK